MLLIHKNKMEFVVNAAKYTLAKREGACMNRLRSTMWIIWLSQTQTSVVSEHANKIGIIVFSRMRLSLFIKTLTGTFVLS